MIRHLFTLIWNRKRANGLLIAEIFLAFVVLFAVGSVGVFNYRNYRAPLGFRYENVWRLDLSAGTQPRAEQYATLQRVLQQVRGTPGVVSATRSSDNTPFAFTTNNVWLEAGKGATRRKADMVDNYESGPELREVMSLPLREGRWFDRRDEAATRTPVVIDELLRDALFAPGTSAVGQLLRTGPPEKQTEYQVVGVSGPYRAGGELSEPRPGFFHYISPQDTAQAMQVLLLRVQPGAGATLEKQLTDQVRAISPMWSSSVTRLPEQRLTQLKLKLTPPLLLGVVCIFLLVNVALGLFGVLWLNINQRRAELGVRRALGATAGAVSGQIVGETLALTTFGLVLGLLVAAQFPLLGVFNVQAGVYLTAMLLAAAGLYVLAAACALYPSRLAARIQPAVALREE